MKNFCFILLMAFFAPALMAQDLIVTGEGDSLNCKITKVKSDFIYFTFKHKDETRNTLLKASDVKHYQYSFYTQTEIAADKLPNRPNYPHFRVVAGGGYSYQLARVGESVPVDFRNYAKDLKSGFHAGGDVSYFFLESMGTGMKFNIFKASGSLENVYVEDAQGNRLYGKMSDDITITFAGLMYATRYFDKDKSNALLFNFSIGYLSYINNFVLIDPFKMTGKTVGLMMDIGYDIGLTEKLSFGIQASLLGGTLSKISLQNGNSTETIKLKEGEYISLSRFDLSAGLRFNF